MCTLIKIIKDGVNRPGAVGAAWKAANDRLISMQSKLTPAGAVANPLTMARIRNAIELAQQHLDENPSEEIRGDRGGHNVGCSSTCDGRERTAAKEEATTTTVYFFKLAPNFRA
eukprot:858068-Rhodomonas_salina.1